MRKIFNLENFLYLIIIFLPGYLLHFKIAGIPFNLLEVLITGLFLSWLVFEKNKALKLEKKYLFAGGLLFLSFFISWLVNG